ncbi:MAG: UvrD-helicase domain-containing protein [Kiritimatiellia bacterium]|jgi:exodeoxyribonuclease V beta subunit|nr:UvrD-helicase domain-containing protein [Kiritimatiellia bacterium]
MIPFDPLSVALVPGTRLLIEANAGTGKTFNIQHLYLRLVLENNLEPSRILVVTFTEAATAELRDRIRQCLAAALEKLGGPEPGETPSLMEAILTQAAAQRTPDELRAALQLALAAFDEAAIFTIHGFCKRTIDRHAFESQVMFDCELIPSASELLGDLVADFFRRERYAQREPLVLPQDLLNHARLAMSHLGEARIETGGVTDPQFEVFARLRDRLHDPEDGLTARMRRRQQMGYDDLLRILRDALATGPDCPLAHAMRATYAAALIDEFQDTDPVQYEIFKKVFAHPDSRLFLIGDPKQAIYGFRGGDLYTYLQARDELASQKRFTLARNFRSARELIEAVNGFFAPPGAFGEQRLGYPPSESGREPERTLLRDGRRDPKPFEILRFTGDHTGRAVAATSLETLLTRDCAARIAALLTDGRTAFRKPDRSRVPVTPGDIAVLTVTNSQAEALQQRLRLHGVPSVIYKAGNIYASADAVNLCHLLGAMAEPSRVSRVKAALLTPHGGMTVRDLLAAEKDPDAAADLERRTGDFAECGRLWREKGIVPALTLLFARLNSLERLACDPACERRLTNLRHLTELLHQTERAARLAPDALLRALKRQIAEPDTDDETCEQRMESDRRAVTLMTIHKSKGLQFPIVFVPYLLAHDIRKGMEKGWTVHAPDAQGVMRLVLPVGDAARGQFERQRLDETLAEHLRLLYVAVTRAENRCVLMTGTGVTYKKKPIRSAVAHLTSLAEPMPDGGAPFSVEEVTTETLQRPRAEPRYTPPDTRGDLVPPASPPLPPDDWAVLSYSGMTLHAAVLPPHLKQDAGTDEVADPLLPAPDRNLAGDALPGGKATGLCLHAILEQLDYTRVTPAWQPAPDDLALIDRHAAFHGLYTADSPLAFARRARIVGLLTQTLTRAMPDAGQTAGPECKAQDPTFSLSSIPFADTRREWEFFFRVPRAITLAPFRERGLTFKPGSDTRSGFMTGSIDLVFRRGDRTGFADWKTDTLADYTPATLAAAMTERNYLFQAILYAVALHTHLAQCLGSAYDYERHFGGGHYFFVRGADARNGLFSFRPPLAELEAWSRLLTN